MGSIPGIRSTTCLKLEQQEDSDGSAKPESIEWFIEGQAFLGSYAVLRIRYVIPDPNFLPKNCH